MKKNMLKITSILVTVVMALTVFTNFAYAGAGWYGSIDGIANPATISQGYASANSSVNTVVASIISIVRTVAIGVAIIMLIAVAMKYLTAAPGDKAEIKKHAVVYVVGAVVLFGVYGILGILADFATSIQ